MNYIDTTTNIIDEELKKGDLFIIGQDVKKWGGQGGFLLSLSNKYKDKIIDTPIAESAASGVATGLALGGKRVMIEYAFLDFILHSADQIINNATKLQFFFGHDNKKNKLNMPIVYYATINSERGYGASHSQSLEYIFSNTSNINVVYPSNTTDVKLLLKEALNNNMPTLFISNKLLHSEKSKYEEILNGKARVIKNGKKLTIVSYGRTANTIKEILDENKIKDVCLIDLRYLSKFDYKTILENINENDNKILFIEEGSGVVMKELISDLFLNYKIKGDRIELLCSKKESISVNKELEEDVLITKDKINKKIESILKKI